MSNGATAATSVSTNVHFFYYPWYGNPAVSGAWRHWQSNEHTPPEDITSNFYPVAGAYDSLQWRCRCNKSCRPVSGRSCTAGAYDQEWNNAVTPSIGGNPSWVSITSFNEWHEGTQIEPASSNPPAGYGYLTYDGAYGTTGTASQTAYLDRTRYWVSQFTRGAVSPPPS